MSVTTIIPESENHWLELRKSDVTSTGISSLFGLNKYCTKFEYWHQKKGLTESSFTENERSKWGNILEESIAKGIAQENDWDIRAMKEYIRDESARMGTSFDFCILKDGKDWAILEIKNVDSLIYKNEWDEQDGVIEAPAHIELQVQYQLLLTGLEKAYIGALVGGNTLKLVEREVVPEIQEKIKQEVAQFWLSIDSNNPPKPNFVEDADFITSLYQYSQEEAVYDASGDAELFNLMTAYETYKQQASAAEKNKKAIKAEIFMRVGAAERIIHPDVKVSCKMGKPSVVPEHTRKASRGFRMTWAKK